MNLGACPHCGAREHGVYQPVKVTGKARRVYKPGGKFTGISKMKARFTAHSDAVRCGLCHHIRRDWLVVDGELVRGE